MVPVTPHHTTPATATTTTTATTTLTVAYILQLLYIHTYSLKQSNSLMFWSIWLSSKTYVDGMFDCSFCVLIIDGHWTVMGTSTNESTGFQIFLSEIIRFKKKRTGTVEVILQKFPNAAF